MNKKLYLITGVILLLVIGFFLFQNYRSQSLVSQPTSTTLPQNTINILSANRPTVVLPILVAKEKGIFTNNELDAKIEIVSNQAPQAFLSGQGDVTVGSINPFVAAVVEGANVKWIGTYFPNSPYIFVSAVEPEKIKTVGLNVLGGSAHIELLRILQNMQVDASNITLKVSGAPAERLAAMEKGQIDASHVDIGAWENYKAAQSKDSPIKEYYNTYNAKENDFPIGVIARNEYIEKNPQVLTALIKSLVEAGQYIVDHPKEASEVLTKERALDVEQADIEVKLFIEGFKNLDVLPRKEIAQFALEVIQTVNESNEAKTFNIDDFIDTKIAEQVK